MEGNLSSSPGTQADAAAATAARPAAAYASEPWPQQDEPQTRCSPRELPRAPVAKDVCSPARSPEYGRQRIFVVKALRIPTKPQRVRILCPLIKVRKDGDTNHFGDGSEGGRHLSRPQAGVGNNCLSH